VRLITKRPIKISTITMTSALFDTFRRWLRRGGTK
jgi:hypothetical protein